MPVKVQCPSCAAVYSVFESTVGRRVRCPQCNELVEATLYVPGARVVKPTLAKKVLDLAETQGLLDGKAIAELRKQLAESKFIVTPEAIAKVLVDHGHLTPFQARKLVGQAVTPESEPEPPPAPEQKPPSRIPQISGRAKEIPTSMKETVDLTFAEDDDPTLLAATQDEIIDLESAEPLPPKSRRPAWRTTESSAPPAAEQDADVTSEDLVVLEPVIEGEPIPLAPARAVEAADDLIPINPSLSSPLGPPVNPLEVSALPIYGQKSSVWDSPFLLIGGGVLGAILVAFIVLLYVLTLGTAAQLLAKAEEEYRSGSYASAIAGYETFLKRYPDNPEVSKARVRRGMAQIRQVSDDGKNPRVALQIAKEVLPQIEQQPAFNDARGELVSILPDIADGLATLATRAEEGARKDELVKLAVQAMELVNNPSYLPASLRKGQERRLAGILDKLRSAQRGIQQDQELASALEKINAAIEKANIAEAHRLRAELLRLYPALASSHSLLAAMRKITEKERDLVKVTATKTEAVTQERADLSQPILLADRKGPAPAAGQAKPVFMLVEGAVYGIDAASGKLLWRRHVGYATNLPPITLGQDQATDALLVDGSTHDILRVRGSTGQLAWRQPLGEPLAGITASGNQIIATTRGGKIHDLDASTGAVTRAAQLPQAAVLAASIDSKQGRIVQLGENATLFVLAGDSLACSETYFLDHTPGSIFAPPVATLDHLLVCESPGDDYSLVRVLGWDAKTKRLSQVGQPYRLKGRVVTPLAVSGRSVAAVTDLGQIAMYEIDATNAKEPVRVAAGVEAGESVPIPPHYTLSGNRLWVANRRCALFQLQDALQKFGRVWTIHQGDTFVAPLQLAGDVLVHARRKSGEPAVLIEGSDTTDSRSRWTIRLAAPIAALAASESRRALEAVTTSGALFTLSADQVRAGQLDQPAPGTAGAAAILPEAALSSDGTTLVWTESHAGGRILSYNTSTASAPTITPLPGSTAQAAAPAQVFAGRLLCPLTNGSVVLLEPGAGRQTALPFVPALMPGSLPTWTRPAIRGDGRGFLIGDGRRGVYAVTLKDQPQPQLAQVEESQIDGTLVSPLVPVGGTAFGVVRTDGGDSLVRIDLQTAAGLEQIPLPGSLQAGPFAVGALVVVAAEPDSLLAFEPAGQPRWQQPLTAGPLAGSPLALPGGDLLVIHQSGKVRRLESATGKELAAADLQQPLGPAACILGPDVFLAGSDGVIHRIPLPRSK